MTEGIEKEVRGYSHICRAPLNYGVSLCWNPKAKDTAFLWVHCFPVNPLIAAENKFPKPALFVKFILFHINKP
jgi:hypothetical protein